MSTFNVGDLVSYNRNVYTSDLIGIVSEVGDAAVKVTWYTKGTGNVYMGNWKTHLHDTGLVSVDDWDTMSLHDSILEKANVSKLSIEERVCKKIKELDSKWEKRMAQKKLGSPTTQTVPNVEARTTLGSGQMGIRIASGAAVAPPRAPRIG